MKYLCLRHRVLVARSAELAQQLWAGVFREGQAAFSQQNWLVAEACFGAAFDIAKIRMNDTSRGQLSAFDETQLVVSANYLAQTLSRLLQFSLADSVLQFVRHHLLRKIAYENTTENKADGLKKCLRSIEISELEIAEEYLSIKIKRPTDCSEHLMLRRLH